MTQTGKSPQARQFTDYSRDVIERHAAALSERHLEILRCSTGPDNTYEGIGTWLGIPPGTVRSRLSRARAALAKAIRDSNPGLDDKGNRSIFDDVDQ